jgi:hypothetical protein
MLSEFISFALAAAVHSTTVTPGKLFYQSPEAVNLITNSAVTCDSLGVTQPPIEIKTNNGSSVILDCNPKFKFNPTINKIRKEIDPVNEEQLRKVAHELCSSEGSRWLFEFRYKQMNGGELLIKVNCSKT